MSTVASTTTLRIQPLSRRNGRGAGGEGSPRRPRSLYPAAAHRKQNRNFLAMTQTRKTSAIRYGVVFSGNFPLQRTLEGATLADDLGFDTCWLGEDYFYQGGFTTATAVADRTQRLDIGLGVLTPLTRHPALTVMELGTLDLIAGGRLIPGYGAGVRYWMRQMHLDYRSPLSAMREAVEITRELLTGETSCYQGRYFQLDHVRLGFTPRRSSLPIYLGVEGPKALQLSGEIADGSILSVLSSPAYIHFAR